MTLRPGSSAWAFALTTAAIPLLAAAAFALAPGSAEAATAAACTPAHKSQRGASFARRQRPLLAALRRERCRPEHTLTAAETVDPAPTPCAPTLFAPTFFDTSEGTNVSPLSLAATGRLRAVIWAPK